MPTGFAVTRRRRLWLSALVVACLAGASFAAAAAGSPSRPAAGSLGTVNVRFQQDWRTFDFQVDAGGSTSFGIVSPAYDRLVAITRDGSGFVPYLASSWKQTAKYITFTLRKDAKCEDGHILNPLDVLNSFKRWIFVPKRTGSTVSGSIGGWGPGPYHLGINMKKSTFTLRLDAAYRNVLGFFSNIGIVCPAGLAAVQKDPHALENATYGSGPYSLVSAAHGDQVVWKLRPEWHWGPPGTSTSTMAKTLVYKVVSDSTTVANLLLTGGLDLADVTGADLDRVAADKSLIHKRSKNYYTENIVFNQRAGSIFANDEKLRQALMTAIDPQKWNQAAYAGGAAVATSTFRPGAECYDPKTKALMPKPSVDAAKKILESDGYTYVNGKAMKNGQQLKFNLLTTPLANQGPDYLLQAFTQLGADVTLNNLAGSAYGANVLTSNFDVSLIRGNQENPEPGANLATVSGAAPPTGTNYASIGATEPLYNKYVNAGLQNTGQHSCSYFYKAQELMLQKHLLLPMVAPSFELFSRGIEFTPRTPSAVYPVFYLKPAK
jgi:peptide/nickel transport system substrate-binding protein